jgi:hypothetical protein
MSSTLRTLAVAVLGCVLLASPLAGQDRSQYRSFQLGTGLPAVAALAGVAVSEAKTLHQRPAVMQELEWRPTYFSRGSTSRQDDPVRQIVFSFYDDQLSRMVIDYDQDRTAGMTDADMIEAISTTYGPALKPVARRPNTVTSRSEVDFGTPIAQWGETDSAVVLYRSGDLSRSSSSSRFRMTVISPRLDALARTAAAQAVRQDELEAPQRERARQKKELEDARASEERARAANRATFRP